MWSVMRIIDFIVKNSCLTQIICLLQNLPSKVWNSICVATWWPLHGKHCNAARCVACSPSITTSASVCKKTGLRVTHKCIEDVMGEGFCNFCIKEYLELWKAAIFIKFFFVEICTLEKNKIFILIIIIIFHNYFKCLITPITASIFVVTPR
jgi:hypothetical protein